MCSVELKDSIALIGIVIVMCGWLFSKWKDRTHEIFKERLKRRLDMYDSVVDALLPFINHKDGIVDFDSNELSQKLSSARTKIQLYGYQDEIAKYEFFIKKLNIRDFDGINSSLAELSKILVNKIRKELGY